MSGPGSSPAPADDAGAPGRFGSLPGPSAAAGEEFCCLKQQTAVKLAPGEMTSPHNILLLNIHGTSITDPE